MKECAVESGHGIVADRVPGEGKGLGQPGPGPQVVVKGEHEGDGGGVVDWDDAGHHARRSQGRSGR